MRKVKCGECGKTYNYDEDGFCPGCGAFNQPARASRIGADGTVIRTDGLNERNHAESFVHQEFHEEKRERRRTGLDKSVQRIHRPARPAPGMGKKKEPSVKPAFLLIWFFLVIAFVRFFMSVLGRLFYGFF